MNFLARGLILIALVVSSGAHAQPYPTKAVSMIIPFPAGGRTDIIGRIYAQYMQEALGKPVAVINKPGASSVLGSNEVAAATPDGYTIGFFSSGAVSAQYTVPTPLNLKNFELIAMVNADPAAIAVPETAEWKTVAELVAYGKKNPGKLRMAMTPGTSSQLFAAGMARASGIDFINVPFKGDSDGVIALAGGHVDVAAAVPVSFKSLIDSKKIRMLAIAADKPSALYSNAETFKQGGIDLVIGAFHGVYVPLGTPADVQTKLASALTTAAANPELQKRMNDVGAAVMILTGAEAKSFLTQQDEVYRGVIDALGLRVEVKR
jgi:tripartite-type tricarboxylate transporter receptor subunit TctC